MKLEVILLLTTFLLAFSSYLTVGILHRWTLRKKILDIPNGRSSHSFPTPRGGGLVIVGTAVLGWLLYLLINLPNTLYPFAYLLILGAMLVAMISWWDDIQETPCWIRFTVHSIATLLVLATIDWTLIWPWVSNESSSLYTLTKILVGFVWVTGMINAYNFMDGIDGIAGTQGAITGGVWMVIGVYTYQPGLLVLGLLIVSSTLGFLGHNWYPARIFMGDVGSTFLGYIFAVLTLWMAQQDIALAFCGLLSLWPFLFDTAFTLLRRLYNGENIFHAHRSHLYQRLVIAGLSHTQVVLLYATWSLIIIMSTLNWVAVIIPSYLLLAIVIILSVGMWWIVIYYEQGHTPLSAYLNIQALRNKVRLRHIRGY